MHDVRLVEVIEQSLNDYTSDQRGDIGSLLRLEAIDCVIEVVKDPEVFLDTGLFHRLITPVVRLAAEKLDKVRFQAWLCLQEIWDRSSEFPLRTK